MQEDGQDWPVTLSVGNHGSNKVKNCENSVSLSANGIQSLWCIKYNIYVPSDAAKYKILKLCK